MSWDAVQTKKFLSVLAEVMAEQKDELIELDSKVGDGDLGLTMSDGFAAASSGAEAKEEEDVGKLLYFAGKAMAAKVPSTMGTLMANGLMSAGKALKGRTTLDNAGICDMMQAWEDGVRKMGKAQEGEKTFLDGLAPGVRAMKENAEKSEKEMAKAGAQAAEAGAQNTVGMLAVHGRAAIRGEESRKLLDPGAVVASLIMKALAQSL
ncbi:MAG: DAK2 domain-containing protein [Lachnospiraceae bacterium]|nr:DAK2 domain-containing protein [Lachnospiraceae bacterium]